MPLTMINLFQTLAVQIALRGKGILLPFELGEEGRKIKASHSGQDGMLPRIFPGVPEAKRRKTVAELDFPRDVIHQIAAARVSGCFQDLVTELPEPVVVRTNANPGSFSPPETDG